LLGIRETSVFQALHKLIPRAVALLDGYGLLVRGVRRAHGAITQFLKSRFSLKGRFHTRQAMTWLEFSSATTFELVINLKTANSRPNGESEGRSFRCSNRWPAVPPSSPEQVRGSGAELLAVWGQSAVLFWESPAIQSEARAPQERLRKRVAERAPLAPPSLMSLKPNPWRPPALLAT